MFASPWDDVSLSAPRAHLLGNGSLDDAAPCAAPRSIWVNGVRLDARGRDILRAIERNLGFRLGRGDYWYDRRSGAMGRVGGPTAAFLPSGLPLGGRMLEHCSGGGTGIRINGRELHDVDRRCLERRTGTLAPGSYSLDAAGRLIQLDGSGCWRLQRARPPAARALRFTKCPS